MKLEWPWKRQKITLENDLKVLESNLEMLFHPVLPRVEFVEQLRLDLVGKSKRKWFNLPHFNWQRLALITGGIVSFLGLLLGGVRVIVAVIALLQGIKKRIIKEPLANEAIGV